MQNENVQEQELDETLEGQESTEEQTGDSKDLEAELAKYKAIAERKTKQLNAIKNGLGEEDNKVKQTPISSEQRLERLELKTDGYSDREIDFILKNGGKEAVSDEMVNAAIETMRAKDKAESATPDSTGKSPIFKRYTADDVANMPLDELEKMIPRE